MSGFSEFAPSESEAEHWANSLRGWVLRSPLLVRLGISAGLVFLWGFFGRFEALWLAALIVALVALIGAIWAGLAAFSKKNGVLRIGDANRWVRGAVWVVALPLLLPVGYAGNNTALAIVPYSVAELERFAEPEAEALAELEAIEAEEQAKLEAERAAEEEARRLEETRNAEIERIQALLASLNGMSQSEALEVLELEGLTVTLKSKCDPGEEGTVTGGELKEDPAFVTLSVARSPTAVPEVVGTSEALARASIEKACYRMKNVKSYAAFEADGNVVAQEPKPGDVLQADTEIEVMVSARPSGGTKVTDAVGEWDYLGPQDEEWSFRAPYAKDGKLFIPIEAAFSTDMSWRDEYENGSGYGTATIVDEFNKEVPVEVLYGKQSVPAGETQNFTPVVPLTDLDDQTPTKVFLYLWVEVGGNSEYLTTNFTMTW